MTANWAHGALLHPHEASGKRPVGVPVISPYTPQNRDNMISWLAARCDFADAPITGKCCFTNFPKRS